MMEIYYLTLDDSKADISMTRLMVPLVISSRCRASKDAQFPRQKREAIMIYMLWCVHLTGLGMGVFLNGQSIGKARRSRSRISGF